jgi:hypothetical protein
MTHKELGNYVHLGMGARDEDHYQIHNVVGLRQLPPVTITGTWDGPAPQLLFLGVGEHDLVMCFDCIRILGVELYAKKTRGRVRVTKHEFNAIDFTVDVKMTPISDFVEIKAEWWRRALFHVLKHPVGWLS